MEGTRHERVAILVTSYIIGFVTGFILLSNGESNTKNLYVSEPTSINKITHSKELSLPSDDNRFVFLCEKNSQNEDNCSAYVYEIDTSTKNPALIDGSVLTMEKEIMPYVQWSNNGLVIGSTIHSIDPNTPWVLTSNEQ